MPWQLDIHLIDVGQGDSTLIVAEDTAPGGLRRTMLIDAGEGGCGEFVYDYLTAQGVHQLDHIVSTHYDRDHRGGLHALLRADDLTDLAQTLAATATAAATAGASRPKRISGAVAAVYTMIRGSYGPRTPLAFIAAAAARGRTDAADTDGAAIDDGFRESIDDTTGAPSLITKPSYQLQIAEDAALAAADAIDAGSAGAAVTAAVRTTIFNALRNGVVPGSRFLTDGLCTTAQIIDQGAADEPDGWAEIIAGGFTVRDFIAQAPTADRMRTSVPTLGRELLWNSGPHQMLPPAGAPRAYVVTRNGRAWQGIGHAPYQIPSSAFGNNGSVGLVIRFNNFFYCTLGDMASSGEDALMPAVMANGLPDPANANAPLPLPPRMASLKCSHHGAKSSTSAAYLDEADPRTALISSGFNDGYEHPHDNALQRLQNQASIERFFLTNCGYESPYVPATTGLSQLTTPGNKSRIAGDNHDVNLAPGRQRGDIRLRVTQAQSLPTPPTPRQYTVRYWEAEQGAPRIETVTF